MVYHLGHFACGSHIYLPSKEEMGATLSGEIKVSNGKHQHHSNNSERAV